MQATTTRFRFSSLAWLAAYLAAMGVVAGGLMLGRREMLATYGTGAAQTEWDAWRADAKQMAAGQGPVKRREPKSAEPPALVLMRDHFRVCLAISLVLSSVLFGTFMFFVRGALAAPTQSRPPTPSGPTVV